MAAVPRAPVLIAACLAAAALSLLAPWALAFDPYAWLVWGREISRGTLDTSAGPSWKPLPILLTTPLSLAGGAAPEAWLVVARAGALLALAGAAAAGARLGGRAGAAGAALVLALSPWWLYNAGLGNSEGLLAAAVLWAAVAHLDGRPRLAFLALLAGSLLRPEVWPFLGIAAFRLWREEPAPRARAATAAGLAAVAALWFIPGALGGGSASGAAQGTPSAGSAGLADVPFLAVLRDAVELLTVPATLAAALAVALAGRRARLLAAAAAAYVLLVALMTQAGYAGNPRYLVPAAAIGAALAGAGAARMPRPAVAAAVLVAAVAALGLPDLRDRTREIGVRAETREGLEALPRPRCATVRTSVAQRSAVAWELDRPLSGGLDRPPRPPAAVLQARPYAGGPPAPRTGPPFLLVARAPRWTLAIAC